LIATYFNLFIFGYKREKKRKQTNKTKHYSLTKATPHASARRWRDNSSGSTTIFTRGQIELAPILASISAHALPS
jgi:hypothetical protein